MKSTRGLNEMQFGMSLQDSLMIGATAFPVDCDHDFANEKNFVIPNV